MYDVTPNGSSAKGPERCDEQQARCSELTDKTPSPTFCTVESIEEMNTLEEKLKTKECRDEFVQWVKQNIVEGDFKQRACDALHLILGPNILLQYSRKGRAKVGDKIPLCKYKNIVLAIQELGGNCSDKTLKDWMQLKFNQSDNLKRNKYINKCSCHKPRSSNV